MRDHVLLAQIAQDFVELSNEEALLGHGVQVAVQAVDHHYHSAVTFDGTADGMRKFAWRQLRRVDPPGGNASAIHVTAQVDP